LSHRTSNEIIHPPPRLVLNDFVEEHNKKRQYKVPPIPTEISSIIELCLKRKKVKNSVSSLHSSIEPELPDINSFINSTQSVHRPLGSLFEFGQEEKRKGIFAMTFFDNKKLHQTNRRRISNSF